LEKGILPSFDAVKKLEEDGKILAGGLPVGDRVFTFIAEATSHEELDRMLRNIPAWRVLQWEVTPLQSITARAAQEREIIEELKQAM
jgi:Muconolactone delta-isomerase